MTYLKEIKVPASWGLINHSHLENENDPMRKREDKGKAKTCKYGTIRTAYTKLQVAKEKIKLLSTDFKEQKEL